MTEYNTDEIALQVKQGEADSGALWESVKRFAYQQAARFFHCRECTGYYLGYELEDLQQEAFFAMLQALDWWDHASFSFLTAYGYYLKGAFDAAAGTRTESQRRDPIRTAAWIDGPAPGVDVGDKITLGDTIPDQEAAAAFEAVDETEWQQELSDAMQQCLAALDPLQRQIIRERYWHCKKYDEAAKRMGATPAAVKAEADKALRVLRQKKYTDILRQYALDDIAWGNHASVGLNSFNNTWTSATELAVIKKDQMERQLRA